MSPLLACPALAALALGGCGRGSDAAPAATIDGPVAVALGEELMTDPDLARQNHASAALSGGGPANAQVPLESRSPQAIAAARGEAAGLAGGSLRRAPPAEPGSMTAAGETLALTANGALATTGARSCARDLDYTFAWAAKFPATLPIYPRGHVQEAAGNDLDGCSLRVANFVTPATVSDVVDFYWTVGTRAGLSPRHRLAGSDHVVAGSKGAAAFVAYVRERHGLTEVDLVTNRF